ncbi:MAG: metallophosphoesterase [Oscillospiraceae bacterium]|nr:metallophosphoesterase [Oscillospiraceae bacterium]
MLKGLRRRLTLIIFVAVIAALFYDSNNRLVTETFTMSDPALPPAFQGLRIAVISDMHMASFGQGNETLFAAVRDTAPDIICVLGDVIDGTYPQDPAAAEAVKAEERQYITELFSGLVAIAPCYFVSGNHDWASGWAREMFSLMEDAGCTVLRNQYLTLERGGESIILAGVEDPNALRDMKTPEELVREIRQKLGDGYLIMLSHRNDPPEKWAKLGVSTVLCAHAHGGLIRLPFTDGLIGPGRELLPRYTSGIYEAEGTKIFVSRGLGGVRFRLLNNPQVALIELTRED